MAFFSTNTASQPSLGKGLLRSISGAFARGMKHVQVAQMTSTLNRMSDETLETIGVQRSEIVQYAEKLVFETESMN